ncbi:hypothetical protein [Reyranella sp.]|uniref:hypothetical protein n=1 Tax=Reyranella sp. TaxID=1929291 RepID=UPI003BAA198F
MTFTLDGLTLAQAQANLDAWVACSLAVAKKQSYTIQVEGSSRTMTSADAVHIDKMIDYWQGKVRAIAAAESSGGRRRGIRVTRGVASW